MKRVASGLMWIVIALLGAGGYAALALRRAEPINSGYILVAALCTYAIGFRFYSKWIAARTLALDDRRATPCEVHDDGKDFVRTNPWIVFGHHFAAISGPGPLVGPVLAAQFGYLPGTLWILIGCVLGGAVQDFVILFCSLRRNGKSLGQMVKEELSQTAGSLALIAILAIMVILLAVLALVVVQALADSPWGVFTVGSTIPIAMFMGSYLRWWRIGKVMEASIIGVVLLLLAVWGGQYVYGHAAWKQVFKFSQETLAWSIIVYGLAASVLPVWLLLAPRDYLSTFMKLGTIAALAIGVFCFLPNLRMPALTRFLDGSGPVVPGKLFPFCFITIACGAVSGFHTLISSGTTPKLLTRERYARPIGYGAMCLESLVAIMAMIAACTLDPGVYLSMNMKGAGATQAAVAADTARKVNATGFPVTVEQMDGLAREMGEDTLFGRTGGAATLAVGMAKIFSQAVGERWVDLWYHFAIMFEALFILTTLDAGIRVGRYIIQDTLGSVWRPLADMRRLSSNVLASLLIVSGWGYFLIQGVRDPDGGVKALWPLFGIANQTLAAVALCLGTTVILKMQVRESPGSSADALKRAGNPWVAAVTLVPLLWLLAVTQTAAFQKIFYVETRAGYPQIGFLRIASDLDKALPRLQAGLASAQAAGDQPAIDQAEKKIHNNRTQRSNNLVDAAVTALFTALVLATTLLSMREWVLLIRGKRRAALCESEPVWLPDYALADSRPTGSLTALALGFALAKELSGEADLDRVRQASCQCSREHPGAEAKLYLEVTEARYRSIRRCC